MQLHTPLLCSCEGYQRKWPILCSLLRGFLLSSFLSSCIFCIFQLYIHTYIRTQQYRQLCCIEGHATATNPDLQQPLLSFTEKENHFNSTKDLGDLLKESNKDTER